MPTAVISVRLPLVREFFDALLIVTHEEIGSASLTLRSAVAPHISRVQVRGGQVRVSYGN